MILLFLIALEVSTANSPVLLFPGFAGSQIQYKESSSSDWAACWLDTLRTIPGLLDKYMPVLQAHYNVTSDLFYSTYATQVVSWGTTKGLDHLDDNLASSTYYFHALIQALQGAGYKDGTDLFGAPYDFRLENFKSARGDNGLYSNLKSLIESIYDKTKAPLYIVSHGEAASILRDFFAHYVDDTWKSTNIKGWISACGSFGGSAAYLQYLISYKAFTIPTLNAQQTNQVIGFYSGLYWSLPNTFVFSKDTVVAQVNTDTTNFTVTVGNITEAFSRGIGNDQAAAAGSFLNLLNAEFDAPGVDLYYYYGTGTPTIAYETYKGTDADWWQNDGVETNTDGDGLVPTESAKAPEQWKATSKSIIQGTELPKVTSVDVLSDKNFINDVIAVVTGSSLQGLIGENQDRVD